MSKNIYESNHRYWRKYFQRAIFATYFLRLVPFLKMIGLNGSMVRGEFKRSSDIDFLVICAPGRLFTTRALIVATVWLLRLKRTERKIAGRICLNRWATTNQLEITPNNSYHAWTFSNLIPLFAEPEVYQEYRRQNRWMSQFNYPIRENQIVISDRSIGWLIRQTGEWLLGGKFGDKIESWLEKRQTARIERKRRSSNQNWNIRLSKDELCLHLKINLKGTTQLR